MEVPNPRRILILSPPSTVLDTLLQALTTPPATTAPVPPPFPPPSPPLHHPIHTPYYRALIPIWTDQIASPPAFHAEWLALPGAADVVSAIGAWIVAFPQPSTTAELVSHPFHPSPTPLLSFHDPRLTPPRQHATQTLLTTVAAVITHHLSSADPFSAPAEPPALFAVALPQGQHARRPPLLTLDAAAWEDLCRGSGGWEYVDGGEASAGGRNEFGETTGLPRLLEALQAVEWDADVDADADVDGGGGEWGVGSGEEVSESGEGEGEGALEGVEAYEEGAMREPMLLAGAGAGTERRTASPEGEGASGGRALGDEGLDGMDGDGDGEVQALQRMMLKMQAVKELGADLPEGERRKMAARAVREVMRGV
ncbi:hypothetical protein MMC15_003051 [Xylographa vitiligo]|nr:hypothetical protein [Xylographa vitiligo]